MKYEANAKAKSEQANNRIKSKKKGPVKKMYKYDTQDPGTRTTKVQPLNWARYTQYDIDKKNCLRTFLEMPCPLPNL